VTVIGPAPCPIDRIQRRWRWHLLLKAGQAAGLTRVARYFLERFDVPQRDALRLAFDRDPVSML
jgi:primosomal protein N' (replication factor Y)